VSDARDRRGDPSTWATWAARVGRRVVVRHRVAGGGATDVVGELLGIDPGGPDGEPGAAVLRVAAPNGERSVPVRDVLAGKVVPPRPVRAAAPHRALGVADLESVMALHWLPPDHERLGGWLLRAAGGFTNRANSVLAAGRPGVEPPDALAAVLAWYAARGLPAQAAVAGPLDGGPGGDPFSAAGWLPVNGASALVMTASTRALLAGPGLPAGLRLQTSDRPSPAWAAAARYRGAALPSHAADLLTSAPEQLFATVLDGDTVAAVVRGSVASAWTGVTSMEVTPAYRRRGLARALLTVVAGWGRGLGSASVYLQVAETNAVAAAAYASAGFEPHHRYDYLRAPASG